MSISLIIVLSITAVFAGLMVVGGIAMCCSEAADFARELRDQFWLNK